MRQNDVDARTVFDAALDLDPGARSAYVDQACAGDSRLHALVTNLLHWHVAADDFLPVPDDAPVEATSDGSDEHVGKKAGPYLLLRVIGRGGMATVYEAQRDDGRYERTVAVKVLDARHPAHEVSRRVRHEREALAALEHPNIARLLDAGELESGQPYLVMERVDGVPVDAYCRTKALGTPARLQLFLQICAAVAAAHQRTILHRDLKPSNILVTNEGAAKLLDFGLARPLGGGAATTVASRWLTPAYASPEQLRGMSLTTGSDVYALGVVLFEVLTGRLPYAAARDIPVAVVHEILSEEVLHLRAVAPSLPADLDAIVARALHPMPDRRYQTVAQFADDVQRFLDGRPVVAQPDRAAYRLKRFVQRHAGGVALFAVGATLLVAAMLAALYQGLAARRQADANRRLLYSAEMRLAGQAFDAGNQVEVNALLDRQAVPASTGDLRGPEWYLLRNATPPINQRLVVPATVNGLAWSPDERWLATAASDGEISLWNSTTWDHTVVGQHEGKAWQVAFSPDGQWLASVGSDGRLRTRRVSAVQSSRVDNRDPTEPQTVAAHTAAARSLAFSPDGTMLVTGGDDGVVAVRQTSAIASAHQAILRSGTAIRSVAFSPDGRFLAAGSVSGVAYLWNGDLRAAPRLLRAAGSVLNGVTFSHDSRHLIAASASGIAVQWDVQSGLLTQSEQVDDGMMEAVAVRRDGTTTIGAHGPWLTQWRRPGWELSGKFAAHGGRVVAVALSPSGSRIATAGSDRTVKVWSSNQSVWPPWMLGHDRDVWRVAFSSDSRELVSASNDGSIRIWDGDRRASLARIQSGVWQVKGVALSPDNRLLVGGLPDGRIVVWERQTGRVLCQARIHTAQVIDVAVSPDGALLVAAGEDGKASLWRLADLSLVREVKHAPRVSSIAFSPDGASFATTSDDATVRVWAVADGRLLGTLKGHDDSVHDVAFSPDNRLIVTAGADNSVRVWNRLTLEPLLRLTGHAERVWAVAVSPDSRRIASASSDATIKIWDATTGAELLSLRGPSAWRHVSFSPNGLRLAAGSASGLVALWETGAARRVPTDQE